MRVIANTLFIVRTNMTPRDRAGVAMIVVSLAVLATATEQLVPLLRLTTEIALADIANPSLPATSPSGG